MITRIHSHETWEQEFGNRNDSWGPSEKHYVRLSFVPINVEDGTGYEEPDASTGYAPVEIINNDDNWNRGLNFKVTNKVQLVFNAFTETLYEDDGVTFKPITHWFVSETPTGPAIYFGEFKEHKVIQETTVIWIDRDHLIFERTNPPVETTP